MLSCKVEARRWGTSSRPFKFSIWKMLRGFSSISPPAMGLSEEDWPRGTRLVPFIPPAIQRSGDPSLSLAQRHQNESQEKASALFSTAPQMLVTYSGELAPQVRPFLRTRNSSVRKWTGATMLSNNEWRTDLQLVEDFQAPPFQSTEPLSGGVGVIRSQAQCPFRAFAEYRLYAQRPEDACFGFDARERGGYLHRALENVWKRLGSSEELHRVSGAELDGIVNEAVVEALASERTVRSATSFHPRREIAFGRQSSTGSTKKRGTEELHSEWNMSRKKRRLRSTGFSCVSAWIGLTVSRTAALC